MPVPQTINDLDIVPAKNSPPASENVGPIANQYFQAAFAFLRQIANGAYFKPLAALSMNGQKLTNLADGDTSSSSKDAITGAQARALAYKVGDMKMWYGAVANIAKVHGPGWQLADGTNGSPDMRDAFPVGAGKAYALGATGGRNSVTAAQLPQHRHPTTESAHNHVLVDNGHNHATDEVPHSHTVPNVVGEGAGNGSVPTSGGWSAQKQVTLGTSTSRTGVTVRAAGTGISINAAKTGVTVEPDPNAPSSMDIRPPYVALLFLYYTGIGA